MENRLVMNSEIHLPVHPSAEMKTTPRVNEVFFIDLPWILKSTLFVNTLYLYLSRSINSCIHAKTPNNVATFLEFVKSFFETGSELTGSHG